MWMRFFYISFLQVLREICVVFEILIRYEISRLYCWQRVIRPQVYIYKSFYKSNKSTISNLFDKNFYLEKLPFSTV